MPVDPFTGPTTGDPFSTPPPPSYAPPAVTEPFTPPSSAPPGPPEPFTPTPPPYAPPISGAGYPPAQPYSPPPQYGPPAQAPYSPAPGQPPYGAPAQPYPGQPYPGQPYPGQPYPGQAYPGQPYPGQPYPGQPYPGQQPYPYGPPAPNNQVLTVLAYVLGGFAVLLTSPLIAIVGLVLGTFAKRRNEPNARLAIKIVTGCLVAAFVLSLALRSFTF
ncbi:hypothetical protein L3i22_020670 [Actinoplanes sp. L3-i22]|nr:hypothetical protein L3i22_020670 [Actinoplanes sp. L3-i22]